MTITQSQLDNFHQFATDKLRNNEAELSWPAMFDLWQLQNLTGEEQSDIYEALDESLDDIRNSRTRPAADVINDLRAKRQMG
jgi:hypothetical protein